MLGKKRPKHKAAQHPKRDKKEFEKIFKHVQCIDKNQKSTNNDGNAQIYASTSGKNFNFFGKYLV